MAGEAEPQIVAHGGPFDVHPDPAAAASALEKGLAGTGDVVKGTPAPLPPVIKDATVVAGTSPDGSTAATALLFSEQNAVVYIAFKSQPGDLNPVPTDFVETVGVLQLDAVQQGLPKLAG